MKKNNVKKPSGMIIRQSIQDSITQIMPPKKFHERKIDLVELDIPINNLGDNFEGYKILNLTDIHLGQWVNPQYLDDIIDYVNTLDFDIITLTGDYFSYVMDEYKTALKNSLKK